MHNLNFKLITISYSSEFYGLFGSDDIPDPGRSRFLRASVAFGVPVTYNN
jgi:hypothetical protein